MPLYWRTETAGPTNPLPRHPAAHWWYTLQDEAQAVGQGEAASLLALDLEDSNEAAPARPILMSPEQAQALHRGGAIPDQADPLAALLERVRDGLRDRTLFAPILPKAAQCGCAPLGTTPPLELPAVPSDSTVIGVIDDGIAFAHPNFRMGQGRRSRFASVWQQDAQCLRGTTSDVPFGHVFGRTEIEERLARADFDEDRFYQALPVIGQAGHSPFRHRRLHGTHVADLAAGAGRGDAIDTDPEKFPILAVNLPTALVSDTGATFMAGAMILGVQDIMRRTETMMATAGQAFPLVLNLSFGLGGIGKNGGHLIAAALEQAMDYWHQTHGAPMRVVLPAGNTLQSRLVARAEIAPGAPHRATLRVAPENRGSTYLEIAVARRAQKPTHASLLVKVTPPTGAGLYPPALPQGPMALDSALQLVEQTDNNGANGLAQFGIYYGFQRDFAPEGDTAPGDGVEIVTVALPPNAAKDPYRPLPPCGDWTVEVSLAPGERQLRDIELRVLRNDVPNQINPVRQRSWLEDSAYVTYAADGHMSVELESAGCAVSRAGTLNALCGGRDIVTVAAAVGNRQALSNYSAAGPGGPLAEGANVTLHACADDAAVNPGRRAAGARAGSVVRMSGTSVAAPIVSRQLAIALSSWHQSAQDDPAGFAPIDDLISRGPYRPQDRAGLGGIAAPDPVGAAVATEEPG
ncbi:S8 family serine peptidase [Tritonibacter horizontis]|uniref:Subtilase family protein n=1 Tax=Tritonibacter horizontis TaxID=1768241 RepID=A0A132BX22_9RHOB|nr:S8 family serine peptidase [Tritonibacter horizontis]KUP92933.1 subtilase family protein [Tritonibacter horizontis]